MFINFKKCSFVKWVKGKRANTKCIKIQLGDRQWSIIIGAENQPRELGLISVRVCLRRYLEIEERGASSLVAGALLKHIIPETLLLLCC